ncbi:MAG TPA: hypothetical protein DCX68_07965 [Marinobacter hydrocarbonoclasticus]|nr:hypothetical protein [Marinobacter nauticus]
MSNEVHVLTCGRMNSGKERAVCRAKYRTDTFSAKERWIADKGIESSIFFRKYFRKLQWPMERPTYWFI